MANSEVRKIIAESGLTFWKVALKAGISEHTMTRWMRTDMSPDRKEKILEAINELIQQKDEG